MRRVLKLLLLGGVALALGCDSPTPTAPRSASAAPDALGVRVQPRVTVLTQNIYVGADVDAILRALLSPDPSDDIPTLVHEVGVLQATDFPTRAAGFARKVARTRPHLIGLQEVSTIDIDLTPLGGPAYHVDFIPALVAAFQERGLPYELVGRQRNFTVTPVPGISLIDEDVIFVDTHRVHVEGPVIARTYSNNLGPLAPGVTLERGFVLVPAIIEGHHFTVASTHLEDDLGALDLTMLRAAQIQELVQVIGTAPQAFILGDLNDSAGSPMHQLALAAGFRDAWADLRPGTEGYTCCHASDLSNPHPRGEMDQRLDFILARGFKRNGNGLIGHITRIGYAPSDKFRGPAYPLWVADHAGLVATLRPAEPAQ